MIVVDRATYIDNLESGGKNTINGDKKNSADASFVTFTPEASVAIITIVQDPNDSKS